MPDSRTTLVAVLLLVVAFAPPAFAQPFTRVNDPAIAALVDLCSSASWVDVDGDGDLDLFVTTWSAATPNALFLNDGEGVFTRHLSSGLESVVTESFGASWADVDGDGRIEPFVAQLFAGGGALFANTGSGFALDAGAPTGAAVKGNGTWGEFDNDGDPDLAIACLAGTGGITTANRLFLNDGDFAFTERDTGILATIVDTHHTVTWADHDGDGDSDLFFATGGVGTAKRDRLYRNMLAESGTAFLTPITTGALATDLHDSQLISWADVDTDGDLDAYVLNYTTFPNMLYRNDGAGAFTKLTGIGTIATDLGQSHGAAWGDYDNDGDLDVHVARDGGQADRFYRNAGDGTFTGVTTGEFVTLTRSNWNVVNGDYDRDGDLDLFIPVRDANGPGLLYRNDLASGAHWIEIRAVGTLSNRAALGTKLRVVATIGGMPRRQMREISASTGYGGHNMLDAHFGLGDATVVDTLIAEWPSGQRDTLTALAADSVYVLVESVGVVAGPGRREAGVAGPRLSLGPTVPTPSSDRARWRLSLPRAGRVRLEVRDVTGRRIAAVDCGERAAGENAIDWAVPAGTAAGVYFARLSGPGGAAVRRVVVTRRP